MADVPRIVSVRVGRVREWPRPEWDLARGRYWRTAYVKDEVAGPVRAGEQGLEGDEQFDRAVHGGPDMAVLAYAAAHYADWRRRPGLEAMGPGGFGENLAIAGADEAGVCIGDVFEAGGVRLEVSQPRGPCANISRRWNAPWLLDAVIESRRSGWYQRVLRPGTLSVGDPLTLVDRPHPRWTIAEVLRLRDAGGHDREALRALAGCEALSAGWRRRFARAADAPA